jgi:hypothetical protein
MIGMHSAFQSESAVVTGGIMIFQWLRRMMMRAVGQAAHAVAIHRGCRSGPGQQSQRGGKQRDDHEDGLGAAHGEEVNTFHFLAGRDFKALGCVFVAGAKFAFRNATG